MDPRRKLATLLVLALIVFGAFFALRSFDSGPAPPAEPESEPGVTTSPIPGPFPTYRGEAMSTVIAVTPPASGGAQASAEAVLRLFGELEEELSEWREGSPLAEVNRRAGGEPVAVPPDLLELVGRSLELAEETGGAFDSTWAVLWGVWDFTAEEPSVPDPEAIARAASFSRFSRGNFEEMG